MTDFVYDGLNSVQENSGAAVTSVLTGLRIDEYFVRADASGASTFLTDALGSTVVLADPTGTVQTEYTYEPFGATTTTGSLTANALDYTGRETDSTGLKYYRARYYHPVLQRFISEDPTGLHGGINLYSYVFENPLIWTDPLGLDVTISQWKCCGGFNHIGLGVNITDATQTVGFYPKVPHRPVNPGVVVPDMSRNTADELVDTFTIKTTPEQDKLILQYIEQRRLNPGIYNLASRRRSVSTDPSERITDRFERCCASPNAPYYSRS